VFDCVLSFAVISGLIFGVPIVYILIPLLRKRIADNQVKNINIRSYLLTLVFCSLIVWLLWLDGPVKPDNLPRLLKVVTHSTMGIVSYGIMYYFVALMTPFFILMLVVITPTQFKYFQKRKL
jgi:hypothetical protein